MTAEDGVRAEPGRSVVTEISNAVVGITRDYTGRGPTRARTSMTDDMVTVVYHESLTKAEQRLHERGEDEAVRGIRRKFQEVMRDDYVAAVEQISGRKVIAFLSDHHMDPDIAVETFITQRELRSVGSDEH